jgi:hypothetical protein
MVQSALRKAGRGLRFGMNIVESLRRKPAGQALLFSRLHRVLRIVTSRQTFVRRCQSCGAEAAVIPALDWASTIVAGGDGAGLWPW